MHLSRRTHDLGAILHDVLTAILSWLIVEGLHRLSKGIIPRVRYHLGILRIVLYYKFLQVATIQLPFSFFVPWTREGKQLLPFYPFACLYLILWRWKQLLKHVGSKESEEEAAIFEADSQQGYKVTYANIAGFCQRFYLVKLYSEDVRG